MGFQDVNITESIGRGLYKAATLKRAAQALLPKGFRDWLGNDLLLKKATKPAIPLTTRERLADLFEPDIQRLERVLDRDLSALRASWPSSRRRDPDARGPRASG